MSNATTWNQNLLRALRNIRPWPNFATFRPALRHDPLMTDDDVELASDLHYFRDLLKDIHDDRIRNGPRPVQPFPEILSSTLELALALVRDDTSWADEAGAALAEIRNEKLMREAA